MVVGNRVSREDIGFGSDENEVVLVLSSGEAVPVPQASKRKDADAILDEAELCDWRWTARPLHESDSLSSTWSLQRPG